MSKGIILNGKQLEFMKPYFDPKYDEKTILTDSTWEYVRLYLERSKSKGSGDALFYWKQAHYFYKASEILPDESKPLTSYYCLLNASKTLLRLKGVDNCKFNKHGVSSKRINDSTINIRNASSKVCGSGVFDELNKYFGLPIQTGFHSIYELLYNVPCVHRAFCETYSTTELFIPISTPVFVKKESSKEAWLKFTVPERFSNKNSIKNISDRFEQDKFDTDSAKQFTLRAKKRFKWDIHKNKGERIANLVNYHKKYRSLFYYIYGDRKMWYIKKDIDCNKGLFETPPILLIYVIFHWLSEMVRYEPKLFDKLMSSKQNWVLHEFITLALPQFIDEISCEITGKDIMCTGVRK